MKNYLIVLLFAVACQPVVDKQEGFETLKVFEMESVEMEFESVRFVPLSSGNDHLLGQQLLTKFYDGEIYILDIGSQKNILRFNASGEFLNSIGEEGRGAEEYMGAGDFAKHGDTISVLASYGENSRIISYLKDGTFVKSIPIELLANSFEKIPSGYIVNAGTSPDFSHRFYTIDYNGEIQDSFLKNETKWEFGMTEENFATHQSEVFLHEALRNELYAFRSGNMEQTYFLDLSEYNISQECYSKSLMEAFPLLQKQGFGNIKNYFENTRYSIFDILLQKAGNDTKVFQYAYDKKRNDLYEHSFIGSEDSDEFFQQLIGFNEKDELIYIIYPIEVIDKIESLKNLETSQEPTLDGITEMDNPIIAFCKLQR